MWIIGAVTWGLQQQKDEKHSNKHFSQNICFLQGKEESLEAGTLPWTGVRAIHLQAGIQQLQDQSAPLQTLKWLLCHTFTPGMPFYVPGQGCPELPRSSKVEQPHGQLPPEPCPAVSCPPGAHTEFPTQAEELKLLGRSSAELWLDGAEMSGNFHSLGTKLCVSSPPRGFALQEEPRRDLQRYLVRGFIWEPGITALDLPITQT